MKNDKKYYLIIFLAITIIGVLLFYFFIYEKPIDEKVFIEFYSDYLIAQDSLGSDIKTSTKIRSNLFSKYNISEKQYLYTISYYNEKPERWGMFFDKVIKRFEELKLPKSK